MRQLNAVGFENISGGVTDTPVDCAPNECERADNFLLDDDGRPITRPGSSRDNEDAPQVTGSDKRIGLLIPFEGELLKQHGRDVDYASGSTMNTLLGPDGNSVYGDADLSTIASFTRWKDFVFTTNNKGGVSFPQKIYKDETGVLQVRNLGLPQPGTPTINFLSSLTGVSTSGPFSSFRYLYRIFFKHTITSQSGVTYSEVGQSVEAVFEGVGASPDVDPINIVVPALVNGSIYNFELTGFNPVGFEVYRTTNGGNVFYKAAESFGVAPVDDSVSDSDLITKEPLYTNGGEVENERPVAAQIVHSTGEFTYYVDKDTVYQSKANEPSGVPGSFNAQGSDIILGLSSSRSIPVMFCADGRIYRIDGAFDDFGQGGMFPTQIASEVRIVGQNSIVQVNDEIYFAALDGFYRTNGYQVEKISERIFKSYAKIILTQTQRDRIYGIYEANERRIWWACSPENNSDNDEIYVADLRFTDQKGVPLTKLNGKQYAYTGEEQNSDWTASALAFDGQYIYRGQADGFTFKHDPLLRSDEYYNGSEWVQTAIQYDLLTAIVSGGNPSLAKWNPQIYVDVDEGDFDTSLQVSIDTNKRRNYTNTDQIYLRRRKDNADYGSLSYPWGSAALWGLIDGTESLKRGVPVGMFKFFYRQLRFRNGFFYISSSDLEEKCTITGSTTKTARIIHPTAVFPGSAIDYYFLSYKSDDTLSDPLLITAQASRQNITFSDPNNVVVTGTDQRWIVAGYLKFDGLKLLRAGLNLKLLGTSQQPFQGTIGGLSES